MIIDNHCPLCRAEIPTDVICNACGLAINLGPEPSLLPPPIECGERWDQDPAAFDFALSQELYALGLHATPCPADGSFRLADHMALQWMGTHRGWRIRAEDDCPISRAAARELLLCTSHVAKR